MPLPRELKEIVRKIVDEGPPGRFTPPPGLEPIGPIEPPEIPPPRLPGLTAQAEYIGRRVLDLIRIQAGFGEIKPDHVANALAAVVPAAALNPEIRQEMTNEIFRGWGGRAV